MTQPIDNAISILLEMGAKDTPRPQVFLTKHDSNLRVCVYPEKYYGKNAGWFLFEGYDPDNVQSNLSVEECLERGHPKEAVEELRFKANIVAGFKQ